MGRPLNLQDNRWERTYNWQDTNHLKPGTSVSAPTYRSRLWVPTHVRTATRSKEPHLRLSGFISARVQPRETTGPRGRSARLSRTTLADGASLAEMDPIVSSIETPGFRPANYRMLSGLQSGGVCVRSTASTDPCLLGLQTCSKNLSDAVVSTCPSAYECSNCQADP
jgi:hypothetical protein